MCVECRAPAVPFVLTGERLCSACELGHPQRYALATEGQLLEARSDALRQLGAAQRLLGALPSLELKGFTFYRRHDALTRAEALLAEEEPARKSPRLAADEEVEAGEEEAAGEEAAAGEAAERDDSESGDDAGDVAAAWEAAAKERGATGAKNAARSDRRAAQKEERKENKRRVKEEQRARRESGGAAAGLAATATPEPKRSYHARRAAAGGRRSIRRCASTASPRRRSARAPGRKFARLEDAFGELRGPLRPRPVRHVRLAG